MLELSEKYAIRVLHTPGHTMESVVYVLVDKQQDKPLQVSIIWESERLAASNIDVLYSSD